MARAAGGGRRMNPPRSRPKAERTEWPGSAKRRRKLGGTGATEKKHAHAILDRQFGPMVVYAKKTLRWGFDPSKECTGCGHCNGCGANGRIPRTVAEDLLRGAFDAIGFAPSRPTLFVQWTSIGGVHARLRKIEDGLLADLFGLEDVQRGRAPRKLRQLRRLNGELEPEIVLPGVPLDQQWRFEVWGWVSGAGFRVWRWSWEFWTWHPQRELVRSPLLARWKDDAQLELGGGDG